MMRLTTQAKSLFSATLLVAMAAFPSPSSASADMRHFLGRCLAGPSLVLGTSDPRLVPMKQAAIASKSFQSRACGCIADALQRPTTQEQADLLAAKGGGRRTDDELRVHDAVC